MAPISYAWNVSDPSVLKTYLPKDSHSPVHSANLYGGSSVNIRNNQDRRDRVFTTSFNSSGVFQEAMTPGTTLLKVKVAILYPSEYAYEQNWFEAEADIRVQEELSIAVPDFESQQDGKTHMYILPRNVLAKIVTNKSVKLKMGYSMHSVFVNSTNSYEYQQSTGDIIELVDGIGIRTLDHFGKVTVILEESRMFGAQFVMLNVLIADISSVFVENFYEALSLPLASSISIPVRFKNDRAHLFARDLTGIRVGVRLSHPRVVQASLDEYNQTLTLVAGHSGECNVMLYLEDDPTIYDVFMVRVSSLVQPSSPVYLHRGATAEFKLLDDQGNFADIKHLEPVWSSSNQQVIEIQSKSGIARSNQNGQAVVSLSNSLKAQSQVFVSQVEHMELSQNSLSINVDDRSEH